MRPENLETRVMKRIARAIKKPGPPFLRRDGKPKKFKNSNELKQDANLRKYSADEMNQLRISVDGALEDLPRRKIRLAA